MELPSAVAQRFELIDRAIAECRKDLENENFVRGNTRAHCLHHQIDRLTEAIDAEGLLAGVSS